MNNKNNKNLIGNRYFEIFLNSGKIKIEIRKINHQIQI